jgi:cold shock CspA family protein
MLPQLIGTVRYAHPEQKFFFIERDDGNGDVYLGIKELNLSGLASPVRGDRFRFDVKQGRSGLRAINVERLDS